MEETDYSQSEADNTGPVLDEDGMATLLTSDLKSPGNHMCPGVGRYIVYFGGLSTTRFSCNYSGGDGLTNWTHSWVQA